jgi:hypothetical protein
MSGTLRRQLSVETRRELTDAVAARYRGADRDEKKGILDEFVKEEERKQRQSRRQQAA